MTQLLGFVFLLIMVTSLYGDTKNGHPPLYSRRQHYTNLIIGGGAAGLYTAWRLSSRQLKNESTAIFEWSPARLGGRVFTKKFGEGQFIDLGAMRFTPEHKLLHQVFRELNLDRHIKDFPKTNNSLYYVRGRHIYEDQIAKYGMPYDTPHNREKPESLFEKVARTVYPSNDNSRAKWCKFFDEGLFPGNVTSSAFTKHDIIGNLGYWNLLVDQLGNEAVSYAYDANGFSSSVMNSNAANTIFLLKQHTTKEFRLEGGYSELIRRLIEECDKKSVRIHKGQRLTEFHWNSRERKFYSTFLGYSEDGRPTGSTQHVTSDRLFLCVPRRALELITETDVVGENWTHRERRVLKHSVGKFYMQGVTKSPAYKIALVYRDAWWLNATYKPFLVEKEEPYDVACKKNYGPAVTDLPLRSIYYFGNNKEMSGRDGEPRYGLLATYDDMRNTYFWEELELAANESLHPEHPALLQPLFPGTKVKDAMHEELREQLNLVHFGKSTKMQVPNALEGYLMNWGRDPYGSGYHAWKAHYKIADGQYYMTRPSEAIGVEVPVYVAGESYSFDQRWIEGAFATAEVVLTEKIGLNPLLGKSPAEYPLICRPKLKHTA